MAHLRSFLAASLLWVLASLSASAATLYISEFYNGQSAVGTTQPQIYPQSSITDQTVALSGSSAVSSAFNASTKAVLLMCDEGCSVKFGTTSSVAATTSNFLLQQGVKYEFGVSPSTYVAAIANAAGNTPGGGAATPTDVTIVGPLGQAAMAASVPVAIASNQSAVPVSATQLPAALGQTTMAASLPVTLASNQSAVPVSGTVTATPPAFTSITSSATGTTAATVATLAGVSAKTTYICGFSISSDATTGIIGTATVAGTISGSLSYLQTVPVATGAAGLLQQSFAPCIPASAQNTAITVTSAAAGVGGNTIVNAWGYQQ